MPKSLDYASLGGCELDLISKMANLVAPSHQRKVKT